MSVTKIAFEFLNKYSGALTFIVTTVYVIATIKILKANNESAKATREQVVESRRQFSENQRLQILPSLQIDIHKNSYDIKNPYELRFALFSNEHLSKCQLTYFMLTLENAGLGTAKDLMYYWVNAEEDTIQKPFPVTALYQKSIVKYHTYVGITHEHAIAGTNLDAQLVIHFKDLLDNQYKQTVSFTFNVREDGYAELADYHIKKLEQVSN